MIENTGTCWKIALEVDCDGSERCDEVSAPLLAQLAFGDYGLCSVLEIPETVIEWTSEHRTARKRAKRCGDRGYVWRPLSREDYSDEIHAINTSADWRQGRRMSASYLRREQYAPLPEYPCDRHAVRVTGVWSPESSLVAYLVMLRAGDLALVSQILGHAAHLENEIMYLLFAGALTRESLAGPGVVVYNRHDSGTDGLRFYKERLGFIEAPVEWLE